MPALNTQLMLATARARFSGFKLRLPKAGGISPSPLKTGGSLTLGGSGLTSGRQQPLRGTPLSCPPALFLAASDDTRDIELQRTRSDAMDSYLSRICEAIGQAHTAWRQRAVLVNVTINGPMAIGGTLTGAGIGADIRLRAPREGAWQTPRSEAIAAGIGFCWENWQRSVVVGNMLWYPAFAAWPGPIVPPMPNIPCPVVALAPPVQLSSALLKSNMRMRYKGDNEWPDELFEAVAAGFETAVQIWTQSQMVMNVLGTGPVPTFAPPYVPVGPVVGGTGTQLPGAWSA
jgi:hypothetical protein